MGVEIISCSHDEYSSVCKQLGMDMRIWNLAPYYEFYEKSEILISKIGDTVNGIWVVPLLERNGEICAERNYRFFPYCAPVIFEEDNLVVRSIIKEFFMYLQNKCESIYLPFDTELFNISVLQSLGAFVELRHTHVFESTDMKMSSRLRNHINSAEKNVVVTIGDSIENFKFDKAIKGRLDEVKKRRSLAEKLWAQDKGFVISARNHNDELVAGIFILLDYECGYMLHTWQIPDAPRGSIALLIKTAIEYTINTKKLKRFDLEGSVINNVDYFFSGFNGTILPYGFIHWSNKEAKLVDLVLKSHNIIGRK